MPEAGDREAERIVSKQAANRPSYSDRVEPMEHNHPPSGARSPRPDALSLLAVVLAVLVVVAVIVALYEWYARDGPSSLALASIAASLTLALAAVLALRQNVALISASGKAADASHRMAEEMLRDRELAYRPALIVRFGREFDTLPNATGGYSAPPVPRFTIKNIGTGPAFNVRFCASRLPTKSAGYLWISDELQGLAPDDEWKVFGGFSEPPDPEQAHRAQRFRCLIDDLLPNAVEQVCAVRYDDWFGNHYRSPGTADQSAPAEWHGGQGIHGQPNWMQCQ